MGKCVWKPVGIWCDHHLPPTVDQVVDCGLWNVAPLLQTAVWSCWQELEHPVLHVDQERPNMLSGQLCVAPRWAIKLQVWGESPYCLIDLSNPPDTQRFGCAAAPSSTQNSRSSRSVAEPQGATKGAVSSSHLEKLTHLLFGFWWLCQEWVFHSDVGLLHYWFIIISERAVPTQLNQIRWKQNVPISKIDRIFSFLFAPDFLSLTSCPTRAARWLRRRSVGIPTCSTLLSCVPPGGSGRPPQMIELIHN